MIYLGYFLIANPFIAIAAMSYIFWDDTLAGLLIPFGVAAVFTGSILGGIALVHYRPGGDVVRTGGRP